MGRVIIFGIAPDVRSAGLLKTVAKTEAAHRIYLDSAYLLRRESCVPEPTLDPAPVHQTQGAGNPSVTSPSPAPSSKHPLSINSTSTNDSQLGGASENCTKLHRNLYERRRTHISSHANIDASVIMVIGDRGVKTRSRESPSGARASCLHSEQTQ